MNLTPFQCHHPHSTVKHYSLLVKWKAGVRPLEVFLLPSFFRNRRFCPLVWCREKACMLAGALPHRPTHTCRSQEGSHRSSHGTTHWCLGKPAPSMSTWPGFCVCFSFWKSGSVSEHPSCVRVCVALQETEISTLLFFSKLEDFAPV